MINISFTNQELDTMLRLFDMAVKANGLNAAGAAFILQQKIMAAVNPQPEQTTGLSQPDSENN